MDKHSRKKEFEETLQEAKASLPKDVHESIVRDVLSRTTPMDLARTGMYIGTLAVGLYASHCNTAQKIVSSAEETKDTINHIDSTHWKASRAEQAHRDTITWQKLDRNYYFDTSGKIQGE